MAVADRLIKRGLTKTEFESLRKVKQDPYYFSNFIYVINPVHGRVPFGLYPYQKRTLWYFLTKRFNIVLKFRQAGLTELISMYCLWLAMFHNNKNIQIISIKDRVAKKVLKKIKFMYRNLPDYMQVTVVNGRAGEYGTSTEMEFANGSLITSIPTTEDAGRSEAVSLLVIDEAAIVRWANTIWAAAFPTLSCLTGDSKILTRKEGNISYTRLDKLAPNSKGTKDIEDLGYEVFTHKGNWKPVTHSVNKGSLETWKVKDSRGNILKATPAHRLYTTEGWKTLEEIIAKGMYIISLDINSKLSRVESSPNTKPTRVTHILPIKEFPQYMISNQGKVFRKKNSGDFQEIPLSQNKDGYLRVGLTNGTKRNGGSKSNRGKNKIFQRSVSRLVYETFKGEIPEGMQVDHINCNREENHINNLQLITPSKNVSRSFEYDPGANIGTITGKKFPDLKYWGNVLRYHEEGYSTGEIWELLKASGMKVSRKYIRKILKKSQNGHILSISRLELLESFKAEIMDIHVKDDHSYFTDSSFINHNTGGSAIINSTPYGVGNWFHSTWVDAIAGGNEFNPIRLHWQMHPERDQNWYDTMASGLGPRRTAQEIDGDFLSSGHTVFDLEDIKAIEDMLTEWEAVEKRRNGTLVITDLPKPNTYYYIGADVATGRSRDYSAFSIMDREGNECGYYKGKIPVGEFADLLMEWGRYFNNALIAPETNDIGLAVTTKIQESGYPNLYYTKQFLKKKGKSKPEEQLVPGWLTTGATRPVIIDALEDDVRRELVTIKDPFFVQEAYTFIYNNNNKAIALGKDEAKDDDDEYYTDDAILAKSITNHIRKSPLRTSVMTPK